ncbi:hypothetical protein F511_31834 [Dorcoceras hygrometricum]|uniref:Uncharacterized protein n=1 Tax=Dorcoceras hygrometricum TaxID=472368 RepID=A0A2Z7B155_9LAMI|nr:hypothetical protein F511_31834 [Dorcoceras hygrometricum]
MTFRVVRTNQYNQDLGLIHSTNGNHLESPNEGCSIDHQVTIHLHAQNITMFPTNETCVGIRITPPGEAAEERENICRETFNTIIQNNSMTFIGCFKEYLAGTCAWLQPELQERRLFTVGGGRSVNQVHDRNRSPSNQPALEG